jgi:hypothetical protein
VERITRLELLSRGGRAALVVGGLPFAGRLAEFAAAAPATGIFDELGNALRGDVIVRGASGYDQARLLYDTRFDGIKPRARRGHVDIHRRRLDRRLRCTSCQQ